MNARQVLITYQHVGGWMAESTPVSRRFHFQTAVLFVEFVFEIEKLAGSLDLNDSRPASRLGRSWTDYLRN